MKIGYARVSTKDQKLEIQKKALKEAGCEKIYEEKISGVCRNPPALEMALRDLRKAGRVAEPPEMHNLRFDLL